MKRPFDLGDFVTFDLERGPDLAGVTAGSQLRATAYLGDKVFAAFRIDVVVTDTMTSEPEETSPIEPVEIPGLRSVASRVHPISDQIADKHAAMWATYGGRPSTRYRDLVDLVLIATTQVVDASSLHTSLMSAHRGRRMSLSIGLSLPSDDWQQGYRKIAVSVPNYEVLDADDGVAIIRRLIDPVFGGLTRGTWDFRRLEWKSE